MYSKSLLKKAYHNVLATIREDLLYHTKPKLTNDTVRCIMTYSQQSGLIKQILQRYWFLLTEDAILDQYVSNPPSITYRKCNSLKDLLVQSHFSKPDCELDVLRCHVGTVTTVNIWIVDPLQFYQGGSLEGSASCDLPNTGNNISVAMSLWGFVCGED